MNITEHSVQVFRFSVERDDREVGYAYLYRMTNDTHDEPYGYFADIIVDDAYQGQGIGTEIVQAAVQKAKALGCYKLVATSRNSRPEVHAWYERLGFDKYGAAFRMDF